MILGVAQHTCGQFGVSREPSVEISQARRYSLRARRNLYPAFGVRQWIAFHRQPGAGHEQAALVGEVGVDGMALHPGTLGDLGDTGPRRANLTVKFKGRFGDTLARLKLLLGAFLLLIGANFDCTMLCIGI